MSLPIQSAQEGHAQRFPRTAAALHTHFRRNKYYYTMVPGIDYKLLDKLFHASRLDFLFFHHAFGYRRSRYLNNIRWPIK